MKHIFTTCIAALLSSACSLTPDYQRPDVNALIGDEFVESQSSELPTETSKIRWWQGFDDPIIDELVNTALNHNIDIKIAAANVMESQAIAKSAVGDRWPEIGTLQSAERNFTGNNTGSSFNAGPDRVYTTSITSGLGVVWQADLFGKLRSEAKAAYADWQVTEMDRIAITHTVIADVIRQRVQLAIALQKLVVAKDILASREYTYKIVNGRYSRGVATTSAVDLRLARENLYSAEADILALEQDASLAQHALDVLLGLKPSSEYYSTLELNQLPDLNDAITDVPAQLLDRRPDLRAAEFRVIASNERLGVAIADLFPSLTLSADIGYRGSEVSELYNPATLFGRMLGELTAPIFNGGKLRSDRDAARARLESQAHQYANEILIAMQEVEDSLVQNHKLKLRLAKLNEQVIEARMAEQLSRNRYAVGLENLLTVLETERRRRNSEDLLLSVEQNYWNSRVDLYLSLGGDWLEDSYYDQVAASE
ncbi:MAG: efflux transporter outer membrane subunit [Pseudomonadota bacterium]